VAKWSTRQTSNLRIADHVGSNPALFCVILGFGEHVIVLIVCDIVFNNAHYFILCYIVNYVYASFAEINLSINLSRGKPVFP
jgi:hypothetical protein